MLTAPDSRGRGVCRPLVGLALEGMATHLEQVPTLVLA